MRAKEFVSEDRQKLDEWLPLAIKAAGWGLAGWQAYDTYSDIRDYQSGKIDGEELAKRIGTDAAFMIAGGAAGKAIGTGIKAGGVGGKALWNAIKTGVKYKGGQTATKAATSAEKAAADAATKALKQQQMKSVKTPGASIGGTTAKTVGSSADDLAKAVGTTVGATADDLAKAAAKKNKAGKAGAIAGAVASKFPSKAWKRGAAVGIGANQGPDIIDAAKKAFTDLRKAGQDASAASDQPQTDKIITTSRTKLKPQDIVDVKPKGKQY